MQQVSTGASNRAYGTPFPLDQWYRSERPFRTLLYLYNDDKLHIGAGLIVYILRPTTAFRYRKQHRTNLLGVRFAMRCIATYACVELPADGSSIMLIRSV